MHGDARSNRLLTVHDDRIARAFRRRYAASMTKSDPSSRLEAHHALRSTLSRMSDALLRDRLRAASMPTSTGARMSVTAIDGRRVFVKRVALSQLELDHAMSTANYFQLPMNFHYGMNSRGFGAWRELLANQMTTEWVLAGDCPSFPLLHHHRVLPLDIASGPIDATALDAFAAEWGGNVRVRERAAASGTASHELAMFFEFIPHVLARRVDAGVDDEQTAAMLFRDALPAFDLMRTRGLIHFDAHWENVLTDGHQLYFADMGLALGDRFDLEEDERAFLKEHESTYDYALFARGLGRVIHRLPNGSGDLAARIFAARDVAAEAARHGVPPAFAGLLERYGALAWSMTTFMKTVRKGLATEYPRAALERALERARSF